MAGKKRKGASKGFLKAVMQSTSNRRFCHSCMDWVVVDKKKRCSKCSSVVDDYK
jgi:hypothetical protein